MPQADYNHDVVLWANEQAALLRAGRFAELDIANIAEEIEDVGKSEQRELASRMAILLMHLLKWRYQPERRQGSSSRLRTIREQRKRVLRRLQRMPSLKTMLADPEWLEDIWTDATHFAEKETGLLLETFPEECPWDMDDVLAEGWLPDEPETVQ